MDKINDIISSTADPPTINYLLLVYTALLRDFLFLFRILFIKRSSEKLKMLLCPQKYHFVVEILLTNV